MSTQKKSVFTSALIALGFVVLSLFFLFDDRLVNADDAEGVTQTSTPGLMSLGNITDAVIATFVDKQDNLFVFYKQKGTNSVFYQYYNKMTWSQAIQVVDKNGAPLAINYGLAAALGYPDETSSVACLFYKGLDASKDKGGLSFTCSPLEYDTQSMPVFTWEPGRSFNAGGNPAVNVINILSVAEMPDNPSQFNLLWSMPNSQYSGSLWGELCDLSVGTARPVTCPGTQIIAINIKGEMPGAVMAEDGNLYTFYVKRTDTTNGDYTQYDNDIYYLKGINKTETRLENSNGTSAKTLGSRLAVTAFKDHIYVVFKGLKNPETQLNPIWLAKILTSDLMNSDLGKKKWHYCQLGIASDETPTLVRYDNGLYLFYADAVDTLQPGVIDYRKIDEIPCTAS